MNKKKRNCKCHKLQHVCKKLNIKDIRDVIEDFAYHSGKSKVKSRPPKYKTKQYKYRHPKESCIHMAPSVHTRLRYIGHCDIDPHKVPVSRASQPYVGFDFDALSDDNKPCRHRGPCTCGKKCVRYSDLISGDITMPPPERTIKHTHDDMEIFKVPSPKTSGEVIHAEKVTYTKDPDYVPPLPTKSEHEIYRPHSGIIVNKDKYFAPPVMYYPAPATLPKGQPANARLRRRRCHRKTCPVFQGQKKNRKTRRKRRLRLTSKPRGRVTRKRDRDDDDDVCGIDEIPKPEHAHIPMHVKRGSIKTHSTTVVPCRKEQRDTHYGILAGSFNMFDSKFGKSRGKQAITMSVMAYCLAFHYHPKQWTIRLVDNVMEAGDKWYLQLLENLHDHSSVMGMCEVLPFNKKQTLVLNGKRMRVLLGEPDIVGYTLSQDPTVYNLCKGLKAFFINNRAGVFLSRVSKVMIWKDRICYYIFDPAGRDYRAMSDFTNGFAALINVKDLKAVADILLARTILDDQKYVLAPVKVLKMVDEKADEDLESEPELTQADKVMMGYRILTDSSGIVSANMHAGDKSFEDARFRQALPIAVVAMTYAKISPANTWFSKTIDKILRLGTKLYRDCSHPKVVIDLTIDNIPNEIAIGPYACEIIIYRDRIKGQLFSTKECLLNIKTGLDEFFSHGYNSGIIEFANYTLAVWRQREMFYLFDPYPRSLEGLRTFDGHACCFMLLNTETTADVFTKIWDYLPATTQFYIHAFKVLRLKKKEEKMRITCTLSGTNLHGHRHRKVKRHVLRASHSKVSRGVLCYSFPVDNEDRRDKSGVQLDEEKLGDIVSLMDSVQEDYLPPIPPKYKHMQPEQPEEKILDLCSPSVSATQVVPAWPRPRDKTGEPTEPDPSPEPTPPSTPSVAPEEEEGEEEEEEEKTKEEKKEELPPPLPPPPPSPQSDSEPEPELAMAQPTQPAGEEVETVLGPPVKVDREILLNEDTHYRYKLRKMRTKEIPTEYQERSSALEDLAKPSNFKELPDKSQIIRGSNSVVDLDVLPFVAIMAIVTSHKYTVNTWTPGLVDFIVKTGKMLHEKKSARFQLAPVHIIPKITIGKETYYANIDAVTEGVTWQLEDILSCKFLAKHDRGMLTTVTYSCAFFLRNNLFYLYDGTPCDPMGLRNNDGKACFLRYRNLHDLVMRIVNNKDGVGDDQHFILSRIIVRRLIKQPTSLPSRDVSPKSRKSSAQGSATPITGARRSSSLHVGLSEPKSQTAVGYQLINDELKIQGTTALKDQNTKSSNVKSCHFVSLVAMLMATMHPLHTWDHTTVDICIEKGLEIYEKAANLSPCEKRIIKNIILDGKIITVNLKRIVVVNENPEKLLEQYLIGVLSRMKYVMVRFDTCTLVVCKIDGRYHVFDPYPSPSKKGARKQSSDSSLSSKKRSPRASTVTKVTHQSQTGNFAGWILYESLEPLIDRIKKATGEADTPEFYTFELTSAKTAPRHATLNYRLSPLFKPDGSPNESYPKPRNIKPVVNEKMYWLKIDTVPWSRVNPCNDLGTPRGVPKSLWKDWDIEFAGDLYSLWGTIHPKDSKFAESQRGKQYLAVSVVALVMTKACRLSAWTSSLLDGIVEIGDEYHRKCSANLGKNHEMKLDDLNANFDEMYPYSFTVKFEEIVFGFVYNIYPERFGLSKALVYFFERNMLGILVSPAKNLAFGKVGTSYFLFDCQSFGTPIFSPGRGASYILKCESLNRLVYCMTVTLNIKRHDQQFHLFSVSVTLNEKK